MGLGIDTLAVATRRVARPCARIIAEAGENLLASTETVVDRQAVIAAASRLADVLRRYHEEHPLDPGMSLQALRAAVGASAPPSAVLDAVLDLGIKSGQLEVAGSVARRARWRPALDARATDASDKPRDASPMLGGRCPPWQSSSGSFPGSPVRALLSHLAPPALPSRSMPNATRRKGLLAEFRAALEAALVELGTATPAELRDRFGLTRKYLIPLLEWADRHGSLVVRATPGAREVDSRERRLVGLIQRPGSMSLTQHKESRPEFTSRSPRGAVDEAVRLGIAGARALGSGAEGGTRWVSGQTPPPTIGPQQNRSFNPATTIPFKVSGELFLKGHRPVVSVRIYNVLAQLVAIPILRGSGKALDSLALSCPTTMGCAYSAYWDGYVRAYRPAGQFGRLHLPAGHRRQSGHAKDRREVTGTAEGLMRKRTFAACLVVPVLVLAARSPVPWSSTAAAETARIRTRLAAVERTLRATDVFARPASERRARSRNLDVLHEYWRARCLSQKTRAFRARAFHIVDRYGTRCAMAYLIEQSGRATSWRASQPPTTTARIRDLKSDPSWLLGCERTACRWVRRR